MTMLPKGTLGAECLVLETWHTDKILHVQFLPTEGGGCLISVVSLWLWASAPAAVAPQTASLFASLAFVASGDLLVALACVALRGFALCGLQCPAGRYGLCCPSWLLPFVACGGNKVAMVGVALRGFCPLWLMVPCRSPWLVLPFVAFALCGLR